LLGLYWRFKELFINDLRRLEEFHTRPSQTHAPMFLLCAKLWTDGT